MIIQVFGQIGLNKKGSLQETAGVFQVQFLVWALLLSS